MMRNRLSVFLLVLPWLAGCAAYQPMQFEPVKKAAAVAPKFSQSYYYYDRNQTLYFVMRSSSTDPATGKPVDQIATVRVFWRPKGGVTTLDPSALNATLRYIVMTPDAVGLYEGAGFVRLNSATGDYKFEARIMDGDMRLTQASARFVDTLGRARVSGYFTATYNDTLALDMWLGAEREFFSRSLVSKPAGPDTQPATMPATTTVPATMPAGPGQ